MAQRGHPGSTLDCVRSTHFHTLPKLLITGWYFSFPISHLFEIALEITETLALICTSSQPESLARNISTPH